MKDQEHLDAAIRKVVRSENCSGCGACCLLDRNLEMRMSDQGYLRPVRTPGASDHPSPLGIPSKDGAKTFRSICPGRQVVAPRPDGSRRHPTMGPVVSAWQAWAADPAERYRGSSGGVLTALSSWLIEQGEVTHIIGARAEASEPSKTVTVRIQTGHEALEAAGSRYAPVANAADLGATEPTAGFVGKPCEVSALRRLDRECGRSSAESPLYLSFFCAGTPSQHATIGLLADLGVNSKEPLHDLWYRGRGWPGSFNAVTANGIRKATYDESWGQHLGPTMQWRCKVCADGVGESSDITAADYWATDDRGYPDFADRPGVSALIARTRRGHDVVMRARRAGVIVARPIDVDALATVQPFQTSRRQLLLARLVGARVAGRSVPRYRGFSLAALTVRKPREALRTARATFRRVRTGATVRTYSRRHD